jgi:hypothetical protein
LFWSEDFLDVALGQLLTGVTSPDEHVAPHDEGPAVHDGRVAVGGGAVLVLVRTHAAAGVVGGQVVQLESQSQSEIRQLVKRYCQMAVSKWYS